MLEQSTRSLERAVPAVGEHAGVPKQTSRTSSPVATIVKRTSTPAKSSSLSASFAPFFARGSALDRVLFQTVNAWPDEHTFRHRISHPTEPYPTDVHP